MFCVPPVPPVTNLPVELVPLPQLKNSQVWELLENWDSRENVKFKTTYLNNRTAVCSPPPPSPPSQICTLYKNSYNSAIFQARRLKFCMTVELDLLYIYLASVLTSASTAASNSASEVNILNSHNSLIFKLGGWNFAW